MNRHLQSGCLPLEPKRSKIGPNEDAEYDVAVVIHRESEGINVSSKHIHHTRLNSQHKKISNRKLHHNSALIACSQIFSRYPPTGT